MINSGDPTSTPTGNDSESGVGRLEAFSALLTTLETAVCAQSPLRNSALDRLPIEELRARLGVATSLFIALRSKHPATASHSLRVAIGVSSWSRTMELSAEEREAIEIAALLHDIGKIGVADYLLEKPGKLIGDELEAMDRYRNIGREILSSCCNSAELINIVENAGVWYHHRCRVPGLEGAAQFEQQLPLGARMIAIVDAYDSMTTDRVYRPAMSVERATAELFACAGPQFDPELVHDFCASLDHGRIHFDATHAREWLQEISPCSGDALWGWNPTARQTDSAAASSLPFNAQLLQNMHDGVIFVDARQRILLWNRAAERMTGISEASVQGKRWSPALLELCDENGRAVPEHECPVGKALRGGTQALRRLVIRGGNKQRIAIDSHVAPVLAADSTVSGATLVMHDASTQITLEERVQVLHEKATRDPLTKVANRAEFDRLLPLFVQAHTEKGVTCSMIICDIDHFKRINDTYGHQAGDEALRLFAESLQNHARAGDLVARYGGEEFVLLCAHCDNATATRRANEARVALASRPLAPLQNKCLTASFGVTEVQGGDTPETFLRRADRALMQAKDNGRNLVVQLGTGVADSEPLKSKFNLLRWLAGPPHASVLERSLVTVMPLKITVEKLRGFVADHGAEVLGIEENRVMLLIDGHNTPLLRRWNDRAVPLVIELTLQEREMPCEGRRDGTYKRTAVDVVIRLKRQRDRRRHDAAQRARQLLISIKSYLMALESASNEKPASEAAVDPKPGVATTAKHALSHWLGK